MITLPQIKALAQHAAQRAVRDMGVVETVYTSGTTPYVLKVQPSGSVGLIKVLAVATDIDGGKAVMEKWVSYEYVNTVLTIGAVVTVFSQTALAADITITAGVENIEASIVGVGEMKWSVRVTQETVINNIPEPQV